jgi:hypothetical protein
VNEIKEGIHLHDHQSAFTAGSVHVKSISRHSLKWNIGSLVLLNHRGSLVM